jgi:hypothetical protein
MRETRLVGDIRELGACAAGSFKQRQQGLQRHQGHKRNAEKELFLSLLSLVSLLSLLLAFWCAGS